MSRTTPSIGVTAAGGLLLLAALLTVLISLAGMGAAGWAAGMASGVGLSIVVGAGLRRAGSERLSPADVVTFGRALLACAVAGLAVEALLGLDVAAAVLVLTVPALVLDGVDGLVARRTGTGTQFGARFDGEVDAFLILVLSVVVATSLGWWVLTAGLARYVFAIAGWALPWMAARLEFRYWRKVVTASVGILLTVAVADFLPRVLTVTAVLVALALLAESFGRDVWWLWRHRPAEHEQRQRRETEGTPERPHDRPHPPSRVRVGASAVAPVVAVALLWVPFAVPPRPDRLTPEALVRLPLEVVVLGGIALLASTASSRTARTVSLAAGALLAVVTVAKVLDLASFAALGRPFNLVADGDHLRHGVTWVRLALGTWATRALILGAVLLLLALAVAFPWAVARITATLRRHSRGGRRALAAGAVAWLLSAVLGVHLASGIPFAAADTTRYVAGKVEEATSAQRDLEAFELALTSDPFSGARSADVTGLAGKDVVIVFVESLGRVALEGPDSGQVRAVLSQGETRLSDLGYRAASAYLTSPTFGGSSWLAHGTLQAGVTVSDQSGYDSLLASRRATLSSVFHREGWRTVAVLPGSHGAWPDGQKFFRFDHVYDRSGLGYAGPRFGFSMPDQFALAAFAERELDPPDRPPVLAQVELTSSHVPWAPLPTLVEPAELGDGSVYHRIKADAVTAAELWRDRSKVPAAYRASIVYSLESVLSFLEHRRADDLVVIMLGDHQPSTIVSGFGGDHDVPVSIISRDPSVLDRISGWGWRDGLLPDRGAPVWDMADFRDRFLAAYSGPEAGGTDAGDPAPESAAP